MPPSYSPVEDRLNELHVEIGAIADAEAVTGNGTLIALLKRLRTLFAAGLLGGSPVVGAGVSAATPAAGTVVGDTGPLAAGTYRIRAMASGGGIQAAGIHLEFQHRDAANTANISNGPTSPLGQNTSFEIPRVTVLANERFRFITVGTPAAGSIYGSRIVATPTTP